ncbi:MAG: GGDEF domain-containing phosphodiesterase [Eubacteriales bacterium]
MDQDIISKLKRHNFLLFGAYSLSILIMFFVYQTGGTSKVYSHLMYAPIAVVSFIYGKKHGILLAVICGLLIGPYMPLNVSAHLAQEPVNWLTRIVLFAGIALIIGFLSDYDRKHRKRIDNLLTHDIITGLRNVEAIKQEGAADGTTRTIVVLTMDDFEETMSFWGYNFSNEIVRMFARRLNDILDPYSNVEFYRYAGMQFIVKITHVKAGVSSEKIIAEIEKLNRSILHIGSIPIYVELQMGIAGIPGDMSTMDGLRQAFIANSFAKSNELKASQFEPSQESHYKELLKVAGNFSTALSTNSIEAAYQYIYWADTEKIRGVEMLARWKNEGEYVRPDFFIPIIEKTDLIRDLTKYMISRAVEFLLIHPDSDWVASINFSLKDFSNGSIEYFLQAIKDSGIAPERIRIEVTERCLANLEEMSKQLMLLRDHKINIAIDDFGSGYSSYQYLCELPIYVVKIDKSIIFRIAENAASRSLAKSIVTFCRENNIKTLAEGVETRKIADVCKNIGIDFLQGYYFHKPQILDVHEKVKEALSAADHI